MRAPLRHSSVPANSRSATPTHNRGGAAPLRVTTVSVPYFLPTHTQAYKLHLHFQCSAAPAWPAYSLGKSPAFAALPVNAHPVTRALGCTAFVLCTSGAGEPVTDEDEACALASALACAATHLNAPWPVLLAAHGPVRLRGSVYESSSGTEARLETAGVEASRPALWAASMEAQVETLHGRIAAAAPAGSSIDASPHEWAMQAGCTFSMRHCLPLPDAHGVDTGAGGGGARNSGGIGDEEKDDAEDVGIASSHMLPQQRRRAAPAHGDAAWDVGCPWSPWVSLLPPFDGVQLVGCWEGVPASEALQAAEPHRAPGHPSTATTCLLRAVRAPHLVPCAPGGAEWTGVGREQLGHPGDGDDGGDVTHAGSSPSLGAQLCGLALTLSAVTSAESMGALASGDWFEAHGDGGVPPAPPEHVLQDVLRDILDAPPLPMAWNTTGRASHGMVGKGKGVNTSGAGASLFASLPRCCPPDQLLARVAMHALTFGNARAVALLWTRVLRELRFTHWETGVPVPRMDSACCAPDGVPDVSACLAHQKLQMLNICMARRAEEAAQAAAAAADAQEQAARGVTSLLDQARTADAAAAAVAKKAAAGWEEAWDDDGDGDAVQSSGWTEATHVGVPPSPGGGDEGFETASDGEGENGETATKVEEEAARRSPQPGIQETPAQLYPAGPPRGVAQALPWRLCLWPHMKANEPRTLRPAVMTEDLLRDRDLALAALSVAEDDGHQPATMAASSAASQQEQAATAAFARARLQAGPLLSDMSAFKAANLHQGGGTLADFVRWHSPRDWVADEEGEDAAVPDAGTSKHPGPGAAAARAPKGRLSDRMAVRDGLWAQLWAQAPPQAAAEQKPLQDACAAGEAALHSLEMMPPADVFASLLACGAAAVGAMLGSSEGCSLPTATAQLHAASRTCAAVLQRPCPFTDEWLALCEAVAAAERAVSSATWLHRHLGACAPRAAEAVLHATLAQPAMAAVEVAFHDSPDGRAECEALLSRLPQGSDTEPVLSEWVLTATTTAAGLPPRRLAHRLYTRVEAGRVDMGLAVQS